MSQMPSNDDLKHQNEGEAKGRTSSDSPVASVLPDVHRAGADETSAPPLSSDHGMPQEFTFFQKKKRADQTSLAPSLAYASAAQVTAFTARLDSAGGQCQNTTPYRRVDDIDVRGGAHRDNRYIKTNAKIASVKMVVPRMFGRRWRGVVFAFPIWKWLDNATSGNFGKIIIHRSEYF